MRSWSRDTGRPGAVSTESRSDVSLRVRRRKIWCKHAAWSGGVQLGKMPISHSRISHSVTSKSDIFHTTGPIHRSRHHTTVRQKGYPASLPHAYQTHMRPRQAHRSSQLASPTELHVFLTFKPNRVNTFSRRLVVRLSPVVGLYSLEGPSPSFNHNIPTCCQHTKPPPPRQPSIASQGRHFLGSRLTLKGNLQRHVSFPRKTYVPLKTEERPTGQGRVSRNSS